MNVTNVYSTQRTAQLLMFRVNRTTVLNLAAGKVDETIGTV